MPDVAKPRRAPKPKHIFVDPSGKQISVKGVNKLWRDLWTFYYGSQPTQNGTLTVVDMDNPLIEDADLLGHGSHEVDIVPKKGSPICAKCELDQCGARNPYLSPYGSEEPLITIVTESVSAGEDGRAQLCTDGINGFLAKAISDLAPHTGITLEQIRWAPLTRCAWRGNNSKRPNFKTKGKWCRLYFLQDLWRHPPKIIMPIGSNALGLLSYKSNAQDWGGRLLTFRGWFDDWNTDPEFMKPQPDPRNPEQTLTGHPFFGPRRDMRIPMFPLQNPRIVFGSQNPHTIERWKRQLMLALKLAREGVQPMNYLRPWYHITEDVDQIKAALTFLADNPGLVVSFDTETNGLRPWKEGSKIVFMMFRWDNPTGEPDSIGFPWDFDEWADPNTGQVHPASPLKDHIAELTPYVARALYASRLAGHNLSFDALFSMGTIEGIDIDRLAQQCMWDTWHMVYTMRQQRGTLSLDAITYDWCPDLAGYDEEMSLLIELEADSMNPEKGLHANYARCPRHLWKSHLEPYVMGDVETVHTGRKAILKKMSEMKSYAIPLAHPTERGRFRLYSPPSRLDVYDRIVSPASRLLIKAMARGLQVDTDELARQEDQFPKLLMEERAKLREADPSITNWCEEKESQDPEWQFDLDSPDQLRELLFVVLGLPVQQLTTAGEGIYKDGVNSTIPVTELMKYAKVDKFTLNKLAAQNPNIRPLQKYRTLFKAYSSYIRPIRNYYSPDFDKKPRNKEAHLMRDGRVHAQFLLTGTRSGRLASRDPNLQQLPSRAIIKRIYTSRFGKEGFLYLGDLSQIELRLIAAACGDAAMVDAYQRDIDLHSLSMSRIFNLPYEQCTKDWTMALQEAGKDKEAKEYELKRKIAKTINFLTGYGGGAYGLQATLANDSIYFEIEQCEGFLEAFFESYPALKKYLSYYKRFIADNGVAVSISGRVRVFEDVFSSNKEFVNKSLRAGCNHLIQATASDMMLILLCVIEGVMRAEGLRSVFCSTVHDSLVIDSHRSEAQKVHEIVQTVFSNVPEIMAQWWEGTGLDLSWLIVPFAGDCEVGLNYYDVKRIPTGEVDWEKTFNELDTEIIK